MSEPKSEISRRKIFAGAGVAVGALAAGDLTAKAASGVTMDADFLQKIQEMLDKQAVAEVMMTYCRALDHLNEDLLRTVFHPDSKHAHGFKGPSSTTDGSPDFVAYALGVLRAYHRTHHHLGNIFIEIDGDVAFTEAYFTAFHRMRAKGDPLAASNAFDTEMDYFVAGRYLDRMEKRNGEWKITHRTGLTDWIRTEPPSSSDMASMPADMLGQHSTDDLVFHRRERYRPAK